MQLINAKKLAKIAAISAAFSIAGCSSSPPKLPQVKSGEFQQVANKEWKDYIQKTQGQSGNLQP